MKQEWQTAPEAPENGANASEHTENGAYTVKKSRAFNLFSLIMSFLLALLLWTYSMNAKTEKTYKLNIIAKNGEAFGYLVAEHVGTVTVTLSGRNLDFRKMDEDLLIAFVDMGTAKREDGAQDFPIQVRIPEKMTYTQNGNSTIQLSPK